MGAWQEGGHGRPKVSSGPAMTTPETAERPFQGWPAHRAGGLRPSSTPFGRHTPYAYGTINILGTQQTQAGKTVKIKLMISGLVQIDETQLYIVLFKG
jgi:hypothetical protein